VRIALGSGITQIPTPMPTSAAMTAAVLDNISGGRFTPGLGPSGVQVPEGMYQSCEVGVRSFASGGAPLRLLTLKMPWYAP